MKSQFQLTPQQIDKFRKTIHTTKSVHDLRYALTMILLYRGFDKLQIAALLEVSARSIYRWIEQITATGLGWEESEVLDLGGHPTQWEEEVDSILEAALSHRPDQIGYARTQWTSTLLRVHLQRWTGELFCTRTIRRHLHRLGYVWKRARYSLIPDPQRTQKMEKIREKVRLFDKRYALLFLDETDLLLFPSLRSGWGRRGELTEVPIHGWNEKRVIFGALHVRTGNFLSTVRTRNKAEDFQFFLRMIHAQYRGWNIVLVLDEGPSHVARTTEVLARSLGIEMLWLPHRSPELNPLETLWRHTKDALAANRQFEDLDEQADAFVSCLLQISPEALLQAAGLNSGHFWLWTN